MDLEDIVYQPSVGDLDPTYIQLGAEILSAVHPAGINRESSLALMKNISDLERAIFNAYGDDATSNRTTLAGLDTLAPHLNLSFVVQALTPPGFQSDEISVMGPSYFSNTSRQLLSNHTEETIQGFFM